MLVLFAGILGVVALPFLILMLPVAVWLAVPTAVFFTGYAVKRAAQSRHDWLIPLHGG